MSTDDAVFQMLYADRLFFPFLNQNPCRADLYAFPAGVAGFMSDEDGMVFWFHAINPVQIISGSYCKSGIFFRFFARDAYVKTGPLRSRFFRGLPAGHFALQSRKMVSTGNDYPFADGIGYWSGTGKRFRRVFKMKGRRSHWRNMRRFSS